MDKIKSKIYYEISIGNILVITSEKQGIDLEERTKQEDMDIYPQLKDKTIDEVDYIELEYGTLATIFNNSLKSCLVNLETKSLDCVYYTKEELDIIEQQEQLNQVLNNRVSDISQYLSSNKTTVADVEDLIIQTELNKILEV